MQTPLASFSSQFFMNMPTTRYPCSRSRAAVTDESTPPDIPTTTVEAELARRVELPGEVLKSEGEITHCGIAPQGLFFHKGS